MLMQAGSVTALQDRCDGVLLFRAVVNTIANKSSNLGDAIPRQSLVGQ